MNFLISAASFTLMKLSLVSKRMLPCIALVSLLLGEGVSVVHADLTSAGTFQGHYGLSIDAVGSNNTPVGQLLAEIPVGATVTQAYLYAAGTPFPWYPDSPTTLAAYNGAGIVLGGTPITNFSKLVGAISDRSDIGRWYTGRADVTTVVQNLVAANPLTFAHSWTYEEGFLLNGRIDGGLLAVVYEQASLPEATVALLDGGQRTGGEQSVFNYSEPLGDPNAADFFMNMSLGISFSCCGQVSEVNINGQRLTSAAGDADDGLTVADGALITAGGVGDSITNPVNPFSTDPSGDDELYNLKPFLAQGDNSLLIRTSNATNDDNIFFLALHSSEIVNLVPEPSSLILAMLALPVLMFRSRG